jgi:hypothetical protein
MKRLNMSIDHQARRDLQKALVGYMAGRVRTFAFDDQNTACQRSSDKNDFIDHPVSVAPIYWEVLLRIVAFLGTELAIRNTPKAACWPFKDNEEWHSNEERLNEFDLPDYDVTVHHRIVNSWWNRIPSSIVFLVLGCIVAGLVVTLFIL